jgi:hypothetical protein
MDVSLLITQKRIDRMGKVRKNHHAAFKARLSLEAIKGTKK